MNFAKFTSVTAVVQIGATRDDMHASDICAGREGAYNVTIGLTKTFVPNNECAVASRGTDCRTSRLVTHRNAIQFKQVIVNLRCC